MVFLNAFLVCGALCALCQLAKELLKVNDGQVAIGVMVIGALLVPTGAIAFLEGFSQMGVMVTVMDAAAAICQGAMGFAEGGIGSILFVLGIFVGVTVIGYIAGALYDVAHRGDDAGGQMPAGEDL